MNLQILLLLPILLFSIVVHEVAHAWQADREGDPTARELGRITLNPWPHLDFMGSFLVPMLLYLAPGGLIFGWAKPVPVDPSRFRDHPWGDVRVSMAGIVSNLVLAVLFTLLGAVAMGMRGVLGAEVAGVVQQGVFFGIFINLLLAIFNLIPIPPLDGSHVVAQFLPPRLARRYREFGRYGILVLLAALWLLPGDVFGLILVPIDWVMGWADSFIRIWA